MRFDTLTTFRKNLVNNAKGDKITLTQEEYDLLVSLLVPYQKKELPMYDGYEIIVE